MTEPGTVHQIVGDDAEVTLCGRAIADLPTENAFTADYFAVTCRKCIDEFCRLLNHWPEGLEW